MNNLQESIGCPYCNQQNTAEFWDKVTKEREGIKDNSPYTSASAPKEQHAEQETYFDCPICGREVEGVKLIRRDD